MKPNILNMTVALLFVAGMSVTDKPILAQKPIRATDYAPLQSKVISLPEGDAERKKIFNAMRPAFEKELHQKIIFTAPTCRVSEGWAFVIGEPLQPNQKPIDYRKTAYSEAQKEGAFSGQYTALLHAITVKMRSTSGKGHTTISKQWKLVTYNIGASDVVWEDWPKKFHAPPALFKMPLDKEGYNKEGNQPNLECPLVSVHWQNHR